MRDSFKIEDENLGSSNVSTQSHETNYLVLDAYHSAATSFKKLEALIRLEGKDDGDAEGMIEEITDYVEKMHDTKKSKSA